MRLRPIIAVCLSVGLAVAVPTAFASATTAPAVSLSPSATVAATAPAGVPFATSANAQIGVAAWGVGLGEAATLKSVVIRGTGASPAPTSGAVGSIAACGSPAEVECVEGKGPESVSVMVSDDGTVALASWRSGDYFGGYRGYAVVGTISANSVTWGTVRDFGEIAYPGVATDLSADGSHVVAVYRTTEFNPENTWVCMSETVTLESAGITGSAVSWPSRTTTLDQLESCAGSGHAVSIDATGGRALAAVSVTDYETDEIGLRTWSVGLSGEAATVGPASELSSAFTVEWLHLSGDGSSAFAAGYQYGAQYSMDYYTATARLAQDGTTTWDDAAQFADDAQAVYMTSGMSRDGRVGAVAWTTGTYNPDTSSFENLAATLLPISIANGVATTGTSAALGAVTALTLDFSSDGSRLAIGMTTSSGGAVRVGSVTAGAVSLTGATSLTSDVKANHVVARISADGTRLLSVWRGESGQSTPLYASGATVGAATVTPTITRLTPSSGKADATTAVTITGTGFVAGATVTVGGKPAKVTTVSATAIRVTIPTGTRGNAAVVVRNPNAQQATSTFTYLGRNTQTSGFSGTSGALSSSERSKVISLAARIKGANGRFVVVAGYATGTTQAARTLATSRANAVAGLLRAQGLSVTTATKTGAKESARAVTEWYA